MTAAAAATRNGALRQCLDLRPARFAASAAEPAHTSGGATWLPVPNQSTPVSPKAAAVATKRPGSRL